MGARRGSSNGTRPRSYSSWEAEDLARGSSLPRRQRTLLSRLSRGFSAGAAMASARHRVADFGLRSCRGRTKFRFRSTSAPVGVDERGSARPGCAVIERSRGAVAANQRCSHSCGSNRCGSDTSHHRRPKRLRRVLWKAIGERAGAPASRLSGTRGEKAKAAVQEVTAVLPNQLPQLFRRRAARHHFRAVF